MANGLTNTGFEINSLAQNIKDIEKAFQVAYNNPKLTVEDNEYFGQIMKVFADRETKVYQAIQQVYNVWTLNGCEGVFLDEIFALNGVFRQGATAGVGDAYVETDQRATNGTEIVSGTIVNGVNGLQYASKETVTVNNRCTAYKVIANNVTLNTYQMLLSDNVTGKTSSGSVTLSDNSPSSKLTFLNKIKEIISNLGQETQVYIDEKELILYFGFNSAYEIVGTENSFNLNTTPSLGNRFTLFEVVATTTGRNPLLIGEVTSMSPLPLGYVSVGNTTKFSDGADVETDAAFVTRGTEQTDSPTACTRPAVMAGLLTRVEGVRQVKFNKVLDDGRVVVTPVIVGGETKAIAEELERTQPINNIYGGAIQYEVTTEDGGSETISFQRGESTPLDIRITYTKTDNKSLTPSEMDDIKNALVLQGSTWTLGIKIFNFTLLSSISNSVGVNSFSRLLVETKKVSDPEGAFSSSDYQSQFFELPTIVAEDIEFVKVS